MAEMTARRPLTAGLNTPDVLNEDLVRAFVKQEPVPVDPPKAEPVELSVLVSQPDAPKSSESSDSRRPKKKSRNNVVPIGLIPVTVRLRPEIAGALKRASLERQLNGESLFTQQELVEQVLEPWLKREGYLA